MTAASLEDKRRVIPIWRTLADAARAKELTSLPLRERVDSSSSRPHKDELKKQLSEANRQWSETHSINTAAEVLGLATVSGEFEAGRDAAVYLLSRETDLAPGLSTLAKTFLTLPSRDAEISTPNTTARRAMNLQAAERDYEQAGLRVREVRQRVYNYPNNGIGWSDLALAYADAGQTEKSARAASIALSLSPNSRLILRNTTRMHLHQDDPEHAQSLLDRHQRTRFDPWLIAAELGVSEISGRNSRFLKDGRDLAKSGSFSNHDLSELNAALATHFFKQGSARQARRHLSASLKDPTDNAIAQAKWLHHIDPSLIGNTELFDRLWTPESKTLREKEEHDFHDAVAMCARWLDNEPYSSRPSISGSFLSSVALEDADATIYFAARGVAANPNDWLLWNNLAVGYYQNGETELGDRALSRSKTLSPYGNDYPTLLATQGMGLYRSGHPSEGRPFYLKAIERLARSKDRRSVSLAALHFIDEEQKAGHGDLPDSIRDLVGDPDKLPFELAAKARHVFSRISSS